MRRALAMLLVLMGQTGLQLSYWLLGLAGRLLTRPLPESWAARLAACGEPDPGLEMVEF